MKIYLTADSFQHDCTRLAKKVFDDTTWQPDLILALWRGGAQPGVILSEVYSYLGRPTPHTVVKCSSYTGIGARNEMVAFHGAEEIFRQIPAGTRVLVVDDVFDTGKTAQAVHDALTHVDLRIATIYYKPKASLVSITPDYVIHETDRWIVFPHELDGLTPEELHLKDPVLAEILLG